MFWLAVLAGMDSDGVGVGVVVCPGAAALPPAPWPGAVAAGVAGSGVAGVAVFVAAGWAVAVVVNSDLLAGTSSRKDWKISLSCGWVHSTLAVSVGTTSDRG
jgi:hypothetical protein